MNGHWVALQDLSCFFGSPRAFLFNNNLVDTRSIERKEEEEKKTVWVIVTLGQSILSETLMSHCRYVCKKTTPPPPACKEQTKWEESVILVFRCMDLWH